MEDLKNKVHLDYSELKEYVKIVEAETKYEDIAAWIERWDLSKDEALERAYSGKDVVSNDLKAYRKELKNEEFKDDFEKNLLEQRVIEARYMKYKWKYSVEHIYKYFLNQFERKLQKQYDERIKLMKEMYSKIENEDLNQGLFKNTK